MAQFVVDVEDAELCLADDWLPHMIFRLVDAGKMQLCSLFLMWGYITNSKNDVS